MITEILPGKVFYVYYDNGTGFFEGPYIVVAKNAHEAEDWADVGYGAAASEDPKFDPNTKGQEDPAGSGPD